MAEEGLVRSSPAMDPQPTQRQDEPLFSAFHNYRWQTDLAFLKGLVALLGGVEKLLPDPTHSELALHARIFYYRKMRGVQVNFSAYKQWVTATEGTSPRVLDQEVLAALYWAHERVAALRGPPPPNLVHAVAAVAQQYHSRPPNPATAAPAPPSGPAWQHAAPKLELRVDRGSPDVADGAAGNAAPYPAHFAELIAAVQANKPVPGVREIPDTVVRNPNIKPVGRMAAPRKPWETKIADPDKRDHAHLQGSSSEQSFPPLDEDLPPEGSGSS